MREYVNKDDVLSLLSNHPHLSDTTRTALLRSVLNLPAALVAPLGTGEWIWHDTLTQGCYCSNCGFNHEHSLVRPLPVRCPECGIWMVNGEETEKTIETKETEG